ncbi:LacI family DNA-binding transcriptional regulator [Brachybacterium subflavum]|uniref:LacI family DNA-binding transcriptional regulator n=1 Tax=Brachybacterium subflavum TaxID=2585206 RepID=UPI001D0D565F|nr:LacI family DNA-binding transcriptional regulator [Brachybacterium subflavum]
MPPRKPPTVYDVATRAGVSIATVSRVLRSPQKVTESTRERVLAAIDELGYVPNASARGLAGRRTGVLGLLIPGHDAPPVPQPGSAGDHVVEFIDDMDRSFVDPERNHYFEQLVRGCEISAWGSGYALLVASGPDLSRSVVLDDLEGRVDGIIVISRTVPDDLIARSARRVPLVVVAGRAAGTADSVRVDNAGGMAAVTRHVLARKPEGPVLYLGGPADSPDGVEREEGFRREIDGSGETWRIASTDFTTEGGAQETRRALADVRPGAVIAANDQSALGALTALREADISVPGDCVVTGFDGIEDARWSHPPLTTVRQPMTDVGVQAVRTLLRRMADAEAPGQDLQLPVDVLLRESCGPLGH